MLAHRNKSQYNTILANSEFGRISMKVLIPISVDWKLGYIASRTEAYLDIFVMKNGWILVIYC